MRWTLAWLACVVSGVASAADPVCALIDPDRAPVVALLEAKLLAAGGATWVERTAVDKVLKEQQLQALFGAQGVGQRVALGKILKADALVLVRPVKSAEGSAIELVVCETAGGLRLLARSVPATTTPADDAAALAGLVREGLRKYGEKVTDVVAVPPFVSNDLGYEFDHLRGAFAKLAEQAAVGRAGVVAVELAEAEALAKEIALAAPGATVTRPLPVYLLGEYRHDGKGDARRVTVKLRAERGGKTVGEALEETVLPADAPATVRKWAAGRFGGAEPADAKAETRQLADRARHFYRLGNWAEVAALGEACLLLDPALSDVRADTVIALAWLARQEWSAFTRTFPKFPPDRAAAAARVSRRKLDHLVAFITAGGDPGRFRGYGGGAPGLVASWESLAPDPRHTRLPAESAAILSALQQEEREAYVRLSVVLARRAARPSWNDFMLMATQMTPGEVRFPLLEKWILGVQDAPGAPNLQLRHAAENVLVQSEADMAAYRAMLDRLDAGGNTTTRATVAELRRRMPATEEQLKRALASQAAVRESMRKTEEERQKKAAAEKAAGPPPTPYRHVVPPADISKAKGVTFRPVPLTAVPAGGEYLTRTVHAIRPAGPGVDVLWASGALYIMKEKGVMRRVHDVARNAQLASLVFDGRVVWATVIRWTAPPVLLALDPRSEKVWEVTDGLPQPTAAVLAEKPMSVGLLATALDPGVVCVVGSHGQAWAAIVRLDPAVGKPTVEVIHEARDADDPLDKGQGKKTTVAFTPRVVLTVRADRPAADGKPDRRVVVYRSGMNKGLWEHPLVIDPDRRAVTVVQVGAKPRGYSAPFVAAGDAVYTIGSAGYSAEKLTRARLPDLAPRALGDGAGDHVAQAFVYDGRLHIIELPHTPRPGPKRTTTWWSVALDGTDRRIVATDFPWVTEVSVSSHYGLVALFNTHPSLGGSLTDVFQVEFPAPAK